MFFALYYIGAFTNYVVKTRYIGSRSTVLDMNQMESKATRSKFHEESCDNLFIFTTVATRGA